MKELYDAAGLMRAHPAYTAPVALADWIRGLIRSGRYQILED